MQPSSVKKNRQTVNNKNRIRIEKESFQERPPTKGIQRQKKPSKRTKVTKSHKAIQ